MAKASRSQDVLQQLIQERHRYEEWLSALEARRDATPDRVYGRVKKDYEDRLNAVLEQLGSRTEELRGAVEKLAERMSDAERQEGERVDALHEVELRAAVGEYTPTQWEAMKAEAELDLKKLAEDKKRTKAELDQLQQILDQTGPVAATTQVPAVVEPEGTQSDAPPQAEAAPEVAPAEPVRDPEVQEPAPPPPAPPPAPPASAPPARRPTPSRSRTARDESVPDIRTFAPTPSKGDSGKAADGRPEHEKTLKCQECGTLNYPTEWYCENCGGELAAL